MVKFGRKINDNVNKTCLHNKCAQCIFYSDWLTKLEIIDHYIGKNFLR